MAPEGARQSPDQKSPERSEGHILLRVPDVALLAVVAIRRLTRRDDRQQPFENLVQTRQRQYPAGRREHRAAPRQASVAPRDLRHGAHREKAEAEMDEAVVMIACPAERLR